MDGFLPISEIILIEVQSIRNLLSRVAMLLWSLSSSPFFDDAPNTLSLLFLQWPDNRYGISKVKPPSSKSHHTSIVPCFFEAFIRGPLE